MNIPSKINKPSARRLIKESQLGPERKKELLRKVNNAEGGDTSNVSHILQNAFKKKRPESSGEVFKQKKVLDVTKLDKA